MKNKPFVLHTRVVTGTGGGPEKTILNSPRYLKRYGIDSACLFMRPPGDPGFETIEARLFRESEIPWDDIAFRTVRETLQCYFSDLRAGKFGFHSIDIA